MTCADARAVQVIQVLEQRISDLERRLARRRKMNDRLRRQLGARHPHPRPPRRDGDDDLLAGRGLY